MSNHAVLITELNLNLFNALLYKLSSYSGDVVTQETIDANLIALNNQETAIELAQLIGTFAGVSKVDILDKSNNLVFTVGSLSITDSF